MNISIAKKLCYKAFGRPMLLLKKNSPEIMLGVGIVLVGVGTVMACKATLKLDKALDEPKRILETAQETRKILNEDTYTKKEYVHDLTVGYLTASREIVKLYAPSFFVEGVAIACIIGGHHILKGRNIALAAAYKGLHEAFKNYRSNVIDDQGADKDHEYRFGLGKKPQDSVTEKEDTVTNRKLAISHPQDYSLYARFFDVGNSNWSNTPEYNMMFLKRTQNWANDKLHAQGHLFLNEVYDMLDIPRSQAGAVVGWILNKGDGYVDFGIFDRNKKGSIDFVNGNEASIILDFNVDGVIYDMI